MIVFVCNICNRNFKRKDYLQKHKERKFPCKSMVNTTNCNQSIKKTTRKPPGNQPKTTRRIIKDFSSCKTL